MSAAQAAPSPDQKLDSKQSPRQERPGKGAQRAYDPHAVLVKFKPGAARSAKDKALSRRSARIASEVGRTGYVKVETDGSATELLAALGKDPAVASVSLDYQRQATANPNDPGYYYGDQNYLKSLRLPQAWDVSKGSTAQVIAVLDSGVRTTHEDLTGRTVPGYNAITNSTTTASFQDDFGHGTLVAGIAAANTNNSKGIAGAAWTARVMPVKVLNNQGSGNDSNIARGIIWATDKGAKVINLSLGGPGDSPVLHDAVKYAYSKGVVVIAAAGNAGDDTPQYPAAYPEVLAVAAVDHGSRLTDFSSSGDWVDVSATGWDVVSTGYDANNSYWFELPGTSFSAPLVSGIAALVRAKYPTFKPADVMNRLRWSARDAGPRGIDPYYGYGLVDAYAAVGGRWAPELTAPSVGDTNDTPARATALGTSATGTIGIEGDIDWYRFSLAAPQMWVGRVNPPAVVDTVAQSTDPVLALYDADLKLINEVDTYGPGDLETIAATLDAGTYYLSVRNYNGSRDARAYSLTTSTGEPGVVTPGGEQLWVRDVTPAPFVGGQALTTAPKVTFARPVAPDSVNAGTVKLVSGKTGSTVATTATLNGSTVTLVPTKPLLDNTPYRIVVKGVRDTSGATQAEAYSSIFKTVDNAPGAVTALTAKGVYRGVALSWTLPALTDLDQVIVRMAAGTTPPTSPTAGTSVYAGTGSSVTASNLTAGTSYAFAVWVKDRSGRLSPVATARATGTTASITSSVTSLTFGKTVQVSGKVLRKDNGAAIAGVPVELMARRKGTSTFTRVATVTSNSVGYVAFTHKPSWSVDYMWTYRGSGGFIGAPSAVRSVSVAPVVYANLSKTSFPLGGTVALSGSVAPGHAGQTVYLQRLVSGVWKTQTSKALSSTSGYSFSIKPTARGTYSYRVYKPGDSDHATAYSPSRSFKVS
ncbi:S8 family serine peptidase [Micromonospora sp. PLK6-60]|uniref:S8 family serine peptidase n=1 Tax=Micromonospora sp. PLK6-60 TaxID=2873383 RepID=UPI001CA78745|nr:S8 family serine peptidase [Micromonospora sp. PLK6-60]MBY8871819.1 S8 family serine peptidase [Micromonospora sp. PLK6-60]